jgi:hypothetical protein
MKATHLTRSNVHELASGDRSRPVHSKMSDSESPAAKPPKAATSALILLVWPPLGSLAVEASEHGKGPSELVVSSGGTVHLLDAGFFI